MIFILKGADFSASNIGQLNFWNIKISTSGTVSATWTDPKEGSKSANKTSFQVAKNSTNLTITISGLDGVTADDCSTTLGTGSLSGTTYTVTIPTITGNVNIVAKASGSVEPEEPETPVNYTFTINPTPTSATVTLSATGYSTVSGTGSKSITVASGTNVTYEVSASGYITQSGSKSITRGEALSIVLNQSDTVDTWYTNYAIGPAKNGANIAKANFAGFAYQGANDDNYIGVPINAVRLRVAQAGTMTIGIVNKSDLKTIVSSQTITLTNPSVSNVQEYRLSEQITLTSGQLLMFGAQGDAGLFYYKENGTATSANGECMYNNLGTANAKGVSSSASLTVDAGFLI